MKFFHRYEKEKVLTFVAIILIVVAVISLLMGTCSALGSQWLCSLDLGEFAKYVSTCLIAIANALLLYATLVSQNRGISFEKEAHEKSQFETTFFNMLDGLRKLTDEINLNYFDKDGEKHVIQGREFFVFALQEINMITQSLSSDHYYGKYDKCEADKEGLYVEDEYDRKSSNGDIDAQKWRENKDSYYQLKHELQYVNSVYDIKESDYNFFREQKSTPAMCYSFFYRRWAGVYEHYLRYYRQLMTFSKNTDDVYEDYINSSQSSFEIDFISMHFHWIEEKAVNTQNR